MWSVWRRMGPWVLLLSVCASITSAQDDNSEQARELFYAGRAAYDRGEYVEAEEHWRESLSLMARASTAINLAQALHDLGRHVDAHQTLETLNAGGYGELPSELHIEAEELAAAVDGRIARAEVRSAGSVDSVLWVDGEERGILSPGQTRTILLDPGTHRIGAAVGSQTEWRSVEAVSGESSSIRFAAAGVPDVPSATPRRRIGLWVVLGVVLAGAAVSVAIIATQRPEPTQDPAGVFPVVSALSWP